MSTKTLWEKKSKEVDGEGWGSTQTGPRLGSAPLAFVAAPSLFSFEEVFFFFFFGEKRFVLEHLQLCRFLNLPLCDADPVGFLLIEKGLAISSLGKWRPDPASHASPLIAVTY